MKNKKDDWEKPRSQGTKFTAEEIAELRNAFNAGRHSNDIARELKCSSRNANKYYATFRGYTLPQHVKRKPVIRLPEPKPKPGPRFYTSNFELEG